jgi:hypothetical protein
MKIKVRVNGKWTMLATDLDYDEALELYNDSPVPRMLLGAEGIIHKQYSDNGFIYSGPMMQP